MSLIARGKNDMVDQVSAVHGSIFICLSSYPNNLPTHSCFLTSHHARICPINNKPTPNYPQSTPNQPPINPPINPLSTAFVQASSRIRHDPANQIHLEKAIVIGGGGNIYGCGPGGSSAGGSRYFRDGDLVYCHFPYSGRKLGGRCRVGT